MKLPVHNFAVSYRSKKTLFLKFILNYFSRCALTKINKAKKNMKSTQEKMEEGAFIEFVWLLGSALKLVE